MNTTRLTANIFTIFVTIALLPSCRSEDPLRHMVNSEPVKMFHVLESTSGDTGIIVDPNVEYYLTFDDVDKTASLTISNISIPSVGQNMTYVFPNLKWTYLPGSHSKQRIITEQTLQSDATISDNAELTNVQIVYFESQASRNRGETGLYATFIFNGYKVAAYPYTLFGQGCTRISQNNSRSIYTGSSDSESDITYTPTYKIDLHPEQHKADIECENIIIDRQTYSFKIVDLTLVIDATGKYELTNSATTYILTNSAQTPIEIKLMDVHAHGNISDRLLIEISLTIGNSKIYDIEIFLDSTISATN